MAIGTQAQQVGSLGLDQAQIADAINRKYVGMSQRQRNEMMRLGTSDPGAFALQNKTQLQQAQQPSEFLGAGRKEAEVQNPDLQAASLAGGNISLGDGKFWSYGPTDTSSAKFGTQGYSLKDIGQGKYDILGQDNQSIGTHYGTVANAINAYRKDRTQASMNQWEVDPETGQQYQLPIIPYNPYSPRAHTAGALEDWEILGQTMKGNLDPYTESGFSNLSHRRMPSNRATETITGADTLYGSLPLIFNNKLLGYKQNLGPATPDISGYVNPFNVARIDPSGSTKSNFQLGRELINPEQWKNLTKSLGNYNAFIPTENVNQLPGWNNHEVAQYSHKSNGGLFGGIFNILDPILDRADPFHNTAQDLAVDILGADSQKEAFMQVAPIVASFFGPWGAVANAANSFSNDDPMGGILSGLSAVGGFTGANPTNALSGYLQQQDLSPAVAKGISNFATTAATNVIRGGDIKSALAGALFSGASGAAGDALAKASQGYLGDVGSNILGGAASGGLNSLFTKNSPIAGSLYGGMSGGLHSLLNTFGKSSGGVDKTKDQQNKQKAQQLVNLFKKATVNNGKRN